MTDEPIEISLPQKTKSKTKIISDHIVPTAIEPNQLITTSEPAVDLSPVRHQFGMGRKPGSKSRYAAIVAEAAGERSLEAIEKLLDLMRFSPIPMVQFLAAKELLNRAVGTPMKAQEDRDAEAAQTKYVITYKQTE
jgi:hypothetical protein